MASSTATHGSGRKKPSTGYSRIADTLDVFNMLPQSFFAIKDEVSPLAMPKVMVILALGLFIFCIFFFGGMFHFYRSVDMDEIVRVLDYDGFQKSTLPCVKGSNDDECGFTCELLRSV